MLLNNQLHLRPEFQYICVSSYCYMGLMLLYTGVPSASLHNQLHLRHESIAVLLYLCPRTAICVSYYYIQEFVVLLNNQLDLRHEAANLERYTTIYVSSYCLYLCSYTAVYVCPHTATRVLILLFMCPHTAIRVLCVSSYYCICVTLFYYICVLILLYVTSYYYKCVLVLP